MMKGGGGVEIETKFIISDDSFNIIKDENKNKNDLFLLEPLFTENYTILIPCNQ